MRIGYVRVSTSDQNPNLQQDALMKAGCDKVFEDVATGSLVTRPGLCEALEYCREGDILVVWRLDRLGRSLKHLIETVSGLANRNVGFQSLQEGMDTATSGGRLIFNIFGSLAEFEREIIRERTNAGLKAARARGRNGGRPRKLNDQKVLMARNLMANNEINIGEICRTMQISKSTLYRNVVKSSASPRHLT